jgi:hypothetical protein
MSVASLILYLLSLYVPNLNISARTLASDGPADWNLTVYYTAVESFHHGRVSRLKGCVEMGCDRKETIGSYPSDFVRVVQEEGTGRITSGEYAGKYLCWSKRDGYWIDKEPKDAQGGALTPWVSAAADVSVMDFGTTFHVQNCGKDDENGEEINGDTCARLKTAHWRITDRFEPGLGGKHHLDLYIGEEDQEDFVNSSPKVISAKAALISVDPTTTPTNRP